MTHCHVIPHPCHVIPHPCHVIPHPCHMLTTCHWQETLSVLSRCLLSQEITSPFEQDIHHIFAPSFNSTCPMTDVHCNQSLVPSASCFSPSEVKETQGYTEVNCYLLTATGDNWSMWAVSVANSSFSIHHITHQNKTFPMSSLCLVACVFPN